MGLLPISGWMLKGGGGGAGFSATMTEQEFLDGWTTVNYHCEKAVLYTGRRVLQLKITSAGFSPEADVGKIWFHDIDSHENHYYSTGRTMNLKTDIGIEKAYPLASLPSSVFNRKDYWLCIRCYKTKEVINDIHLRIE